MSRPTRGSDPEAIVATAAAWLAERDAGFQPGDAEKFAAWRSADLRHEAAVARLERTWAALQPLREYRPAATHHPDCDVLVVRPVGGVRRIVPSWVAVAAAAVAVLATAWWAGPLAPAAAPASTHSTTPGGYERVVLTDGSVLELNGGSAAEVRLARTERHVRLLRGEAHFTVSKDPARPFLVAAGGISVRAVGTAFNVRLGAREVEVLVTEGSVAVVETDRDGPESRSAPTIAAGADAVTSGAARRATILAAGERAVLPMAGHSAAPSPIDRLDAARIREALSWQERRVFFAGTPLGEVIEQFNRHNRVQVSLGDPALATRPVGGSFQAENVETFVSLLERSREVVVERPGPDRIVLRSVR